MHSASVYKRHAGTFPIDVYRNQPKVNSCKNPYWKVESSISMARLSFSVDRILHSHRPRVVTGLDTTANSGGESESPGNSPPTSPNYPFVMYPPHALIVGPTAGFATLPLPLSNIHSGVWSDPRIAQRFGYRSRSGASADTPVPKTATGPDEKDQDSHESDAEDEFMADETDPFQKNSGKRTGGRNKTAYVFVVYFSI